MLTLFTWRSRAKVFLDIACIDQVEIVSKLSVIPKGDHIGGIAALQKNQ